MKRTPEESNRIAEVVASEVSETFGGIAYDEAYDAAFESATTGADVAGILEAGQRAGRHAMSEYQTPSDIARWMKELMSDDDFLPQTIVVSLIRKSFVGDFTYLNKNGKWAIKKDVLREFRKITEKELVWSQSRRGWRRRREDDPEGRQVR